MALGVEPEEITALQIDEIDIPGLEERIVFNAETGNIQLQNGLESYQIVLNDNDDIEIFANDADSTPQMVFPVGIDPVQVTTFTVNGNTDNPQPFTLTSLNGEVPVNSANSFETDYEAVHELWSIVSESNLRSRGPNADGVSLLVPNGNLRLEDSGLTQEQIDRATTLFDQIRDQVWDQAQYLIFDGMPESVQDIFHEHINLNDLLRVGTFSFNNVHNRAARGGDNENPLPANDWHYDDAFINSVTALDPSYIDRILYTSDDNPDGTNPHVEFSLQQTEIQPWIRNPDGDPPYLLGETETPPNENTSLFYGLRAEDALYAPPLMHKVPETDNLDRWVITASISVQDSGKNSATLERLGVLKLAHESGAFEGSPGHFQQLAEQLFAPGDGSFDTRFGRRYFAEMSIKQVLLNAFPGEAAKVQFAEYIQNHPYPHDEEWRIEHGYNTDNSRQREKLNIWAEEWSPTLDSIPEPAEPNPSEEIIQDEDTNWSQINTIETVSQSESETVFYGEIDGTPLTFKIVEGDANIINGGNDLLNYMNDRGSNPSPINTADSRVIDKESAEGVALWARFSELGIAIPEDVIQIAALEHPEGDTLSDRTAEENRTLLTDSNGNLSESGRSLLNQMGMLALYDQINHQEGVNTFNNFEHIVIDQAGNVSLRNPDLSLPSMNDTLTDRSAALTQFVTDMISIIDGTPTESATAYFDNVLGSHFDQSISIGESETLPLSDTAKRAFALGVVESALKMSQMTLGETLAIKSDNDVSLSEIFALNALKEALATDEMGLTRFNLLPTPTELNDNPLGQEIFTVAAEHVRDNGHFIKEGDDLHTFLSNLSLQLSPDPFIDSALVNMTHSLQDLVALLTPDQLLSISDDERIAVYDYVQEQTLVLQETTLPFINPVSNKLFLDTYSDLAQSASRSNYMGLGHFGALNDQHVQNLQTLMEGMDADQLESITDHQISRSLDFFSGKGLTVATDESPLFERFAEPDVISHFADNISLYTDPLSSSALLFALGNQLTEDQVSQLTPETVDIFTSIYQDNMDHFGFEAIAFLYNDPAVLELKTTIRSFSEGETPSDDQDALQQLQDQIELLALEHDANFSTEEKMAIFNLLYEQNIVITDRASDFMSDASPEIASQLFGALFSEAVDNLHNQVDIVSHLTEYKVATLQSVIQHMSVEQASTLSDNAAEHITAFLLGQGHTIDSTSSPLFDRLNDPDGVSGFLSTFTS